MKSAMMKMASLGKIKTDWNFYYFFAWLHYYVKK